MKFFIRDDHEVFPTFSTLGGKNRCADQRREELVGLWHQKVWVQVGCPWTLLHQLVVDKHSKSFSQARHSCDKYECGIIQITCSLSLRLP